MTLKITPTGPSPPAVLTLDGWLTGDEVVELRRAVDQVGGPVVLDLTGLQFADRPGVSALRDLKAHGAKFNGASPYIALLLGDTQHDAAN
jgi:anti-anti-sigma regulatory factor